MTLNICDTAWLLWLKREAATTPEEEREALAAYLAHRIAEPRENPCHMSKEQALAMRDAGKVVIEGRFR